jgi:hypothetical protein
VTDVPERAFDVRINSADGKLLLVRGMDAFELDEIGAAIWRSCDGQKHLGQIAADLAQEYDVDIDTAQSDVATFVSELRKAQLLV